MKKMLCLLLAFALMLSLAACGSSGTSSAGSSSGNGSSISVDEGLLNVEVTLPASFFTDTTEEDIQAAATDQGFSDCVINEDGSVTYTMTKSVYNEVLEDLKAALDESIEGMVNGADAVASFQKIEYNDDLSEVDVYVDGETFSSLDALYAISFYMLGAYYQAFSGVPADEVDTVVEFIDQDSNEVLQSSSYQQMLSSAAASSEAGSSAAN